MLKVIEEGKLNDVVAFHGHLCPGLALGVHAAIIGLREIGPHAEDEEVVAVVETDMCAVDAIQFLMGCTFGKGNLIHQDWGKHAYTFHRRLDGRAIRVSERPDGWDRGANQVNLLVSARVGDSSEEESGTLQALRLERSLRILDIAPDDLFIITEVCAELPRRARVYSSVPCAGCDENTMETRLRFLGGRALCTPCLEEALAAS